MTPESPTAQSGPSDRAIAQAFREVTGPDGGKIGNDYVVDYMQKRAAEIDKEIPPAGARDAVTTVRTILRILNGNIRQSLTDTANGIDSPASCSIAARGNVQLDSVIDMLEALTGKADGGDILIDDVPLAELQYGKAYFATVELPDDIRVPLDELWADAAYLVGRIQTDGSFGPTAVESIKRRIDVAKLSIKCALHAATQPAAPGAGESLESQVDRLASFIIQNIPGEPSQSQGAIDTAIRLLNPVAAMSDAISGQEAMLAWAVNKWHDQVANRPLVNVHRRSLDDVWRQVIRHCGADDIVLIGPRHDQLLAESQETKS